MTPIFIAALPGIVYFNDVLKYFIFLPQMNADKTKKEKIIISYLCSSAFICGIPTFPSFTALGRAK
ncbi:MAG TPA: hypothetical protein VM658_22770 [bacterium]|nr:hypothetical protein [bacterium]